MIQGVWVTTRVAAGVVVPPGPQALSASTSAPNAASHLTVCRLSITNYQFL